MPVTIHDTRCCGIKEIDNLSTHDTPESAMLAVCAGLPQSNRTLAPRYSLITFTGVVRRVVPDQASNRPDNYAQAFADYIASNNLGEVIAGPIVTSRRTGNDIRLWVWNFDLDRLQQWWNEHAPKPVEVPKPIVTAEFPECWYRQVNYYDPAAGIPIQRAEAPQQGGGAFTRAMAEQFRRDLQQYPREEERRLARAARNETEYRRYMNEDIPF